MVDRLSDCSDCQLGRHKLLFENIKHHNKYVIIVINTRSLQIWLAKFPVKLKKKLKTTNNLHVYYKMLLKEKLNYFHQHVNQQMYSQTKRKIQNPPLINEQKSITDFFKPQQDKHYIEIDSTDIFNSNDWRDRSVCFHCWCKATITLL